MLVLDKHRKLVFMPTPIVRAQELVRERTWKETVAQLGVNLAKTFDFKFADLNLNTREWMALRTAAYLYFGPDVKTAMVSVPYLEHVTDVLLKRVDMDYNPDDSATKNVINAVFSYAEEKTTEYLENFDKFIEDDKNVVFPENPSFYDVATNQRRNSNFYTEYAKPELLANLNSNISNFARWMRDADLRNEAITVDADLIERDELSSDFVIDRNAKSKVNSNVISTTLHAVNLLSANDELTVPFEASDDSELVESDDVVNELDVEDDVENEKFPYIWRNQRGENTGRGEIYEVLGRYLSDEDKAQLERMFGEEEVMLSSRDITYMTTVMREINNRGYTFSLKNSNYTPGTDANRQIVLSIEDLKMSVNVFNEKFPNFTGQIESQHATYQMLPKDTSIQKNSKVQVLDYSYINPEATLKMFDVATGATVDGAKFTRIAANYRQDNVKSARSIDFKQLNGATVFNHRVSSDDLHMTIDRGDGPEKAAVDIYVKTKPLYYKSTTFKKESDAEEWLRTAVEEQRTQFINAFPAGDLLELASAQALYRRAKQGLNDVDDNELHAEYSDLLESAHDELSDRISDVSYRLPFGKHKARDLINDFTRYYESLDFAGQPTDVTEALDWPSFENPEIVKALLTGPITNETLAIAVADDYIGDFENGFSVDAVARNLVDPDRPSSRTAIMGAIHKINYDRSKLIGVDYVKETIVDKTLTFDDNSAMSLEAIKRRDAESGRVALNADVSVVDGKIYIERDPDKLAEIAKEHPYISNQQKAMLEIEAFLKAESNEDIEVLIDENGMIKWAANRNQWYDGKPEHPRSVGYIGQVFDADENGIIQTNFKGRSNFGFIPGYDMYYVPGDKSYSDLLNPEMNGNSGDPDAIERLRFRGFEQNLMNSIRAEMTDQMLLPQVNIGTKANPEYELVYNFGGTNLNNTYTTKTTGKRVEPDYFKDKVEHFGYESARAVVMTELSRAKFTKVYENEATIQTRIEFEKRNGQSRELSAFELAGGNMIDVSHEMYQGVFDPIATGTGTNKGAVRYIAMGVDVKPDGTFEPAEKDARTAVFTLDEFKYSKFSDPNRQVMSFGQYITAKDIARNAGIGYLNAAGWGFDDGFVSSKAFAEKHFHKTDDGEYRILQDGDKLMDMSGNKGIDCLIVDTDMTREEAKAQGVEKLWELYQLNPELDVIIPPYPMNSRNNPGSLVMSMQGLDGNQETKALRMYDDNGNLVEIDGRLGHGVLMITEQQVDHKSKLYTADELAAGNGRKVSTQYLWQLENMGLEKTITHFFKDNVDNWVKYREYCLALGFDFDDDLVMSTGTESIDAVRPHYSPEDMTRDEFAQSINGSSGFIELPDGLIIKNKVLEGAYKDAISAEKAAFDVQIAQSGASDEEREAFERRIASLQSEMALMSDMRQVLVTPPSIRKDRELDDDSPQVHDYTAAYIDIFDDAAGYVKYKAIREGLHTEFEQMDGVLGFYETRGAAPAAMIARELNMSEDDAKVLKTKLENYDNAAKAMSNAQTNIQHKIDTVNDDIAKRVFDGPGSNGKHSFIRKHLMATRAENSATLTAQANPTLDLDTIEISATTAESLKVDENGYVLIHRDPCWRTGAIRAMKVHISENPDLLGFKMNPLMDKSFDGDFDGDGYGLIGGFPADVLAEIKEKASVQARLVDESRIRTDNPFANGEAIHPLFINDGMDMASVDAQIKRLTGEDLTSMRDEAEWLYHQGKTDEAYELLNNYVHKSGLSERATAMCSINLSNPYTIVESLSNMVYDGAKGKPASVVSVAMRAGINLTIPAYDIDGNEVPVSLADTYPDPNNPDKNALRDLKSVMGSVVKVDGEDRFVLGDPKEILSRYGKDSIVTLDGKSPDLLSVQINLYGQALDRGELDAHLNVAADFNLVNGNHDTYMTLEEIQEAELAEGIKSRFTGTPGAQLQKAFAATRGIAGNEACEVFYNVIQTNLQIKHDAQLAKKLVGLYTRGGALYELAHGFDPESSMENGKLKSNVKDSDKRRITSTEFVDGFEKVLADEVGIKGINREIVEKFAKALEDENGEFLGIKEGLALKADNINLIAYGGGVSAAAAAAVRGDKMMDLTDENNMFRHAVPLMELSNGQFKSAVLEQGFDKDFNVSEIKDKLMSVDVQITGYVETKNRISSLYDEAAVDITDENTSAFDDAVKKHAQELIQDNNLEEQMDDAREQLQDAVNSGDKDTAEYITALLEQVDELRDEVGTNSKDVDVVKDVVHPKQAVPITKAKSDDFDFDL